MIALERACVTAPIGAGTGGDAAGSAGTGAPDGFATILEPTTLRLAERRVSIIGGNGSGKSTLARLLNGLIVPSSGSVRVRVDPDGQREQWLDTARHGAAVRRRVGFVFTDPAAQLVMPTAVEDIALSLRRTHPNKRERLAAARALLEEFALGELADRSVHTLSGGQKQLLAIAAVLATRPAILIADEPTTLLDLRNSLRIRELLRRLPQQVITVTHDLDLAAQADRTLVIDRAGVVFDGAPEQAIAFYRSSVSSSEADA